ncbi:MAG: hypothetical protein L3J36_05445 [Rhodobacteraceae bacterium]|nr:hypothetical protein [Paracoccaceae bacterium]
MLKTATNTAIATLIALGSVASTGQADANPWNPYPVTPQTAQAAPLAQPVAPPSRFAPAGLEQQLATAPAQYAPSSEAAPQRDASQGPPRFAPKSLSAQQLQGHSQGYAPAWSQGPGGGRNWQGYAPYSPQGFNQGFGPQGYGQGYGRNGPFGQFAAPSIPSIPGGFGNSFPIPGNITNRGVPGFNTSPFGLF